MKHHLERHLEFVHENRTHNSKTKVVQKCETCGKELSDKNSLKSHIEAIHLKGKSFECEMCQRTFSHKENLCRHVKEVHKECEKFECDQCGATFTAKNNFQYHYESKHLGKSLKLKCTFCEKVFPTPNCLKTHQKYVHEKIRYPCQKCEKTFVNIPCLKDHENMVHCENKQTFHCNICNKQFLTKGRMAIHNKNIHNRSDEFKCNLCESVFKLKSRLDSHFKM